MEKLLAIKFPGNNGQVEVLPPSGVPDPSKVSTNAILTFGLTLFLIILVFLSLGYVVYGGYNWIMSGGDKTKLESARKTVIFAVVGLIIAICAFFIVQLIGGLVNIDLLHVKL